MSAAHKVVDGDLSQTTILSIAFLTTLASILREQLKREITHIYIVTPIP